MKTFEDCWDATLYRLDVLYKFISNTVNCICNIVCYTSILNSFRYTLNSIATVQNSFFSIAMFRVLLITTRCATTEF